MLAKATALLALACLCLGLHGRAGAQAGGADFAAAAAKEIGAVASFDPPSFALSAGRDAPFAFYGAALNEFQEVTCERSASFGIIALANMAGGIHAGICLSEAKRVRALASSAQPALAGVLALLSREGAKIDTAQLDKFGWKYARTAGADGAEEHYFALVAVGHGIVSLPTLVRVPRGAGRAIVVQADTMKLCENYGLQDRTPLCSNTRGALAEIARRLESRFND